MYPRDALQGRFLVNDPGAGMGDFHRQGPRTFALAHHTGTAGGARLARGRFLVQQNFKKKKHMEIKEISRTDY
jgi:hypothetical protein